MARTKLAPRSLSTFAIGVVEFFSFSLVGCVGLVDWNAFDFSFEKTGFYSTFPLVFNDAYLDYPEYEKCSYKK